MNQEYFLKIQCHEIWPQGRGYLNRRKGQNSSLANLCLAAKQWDLQNQAEGEVETPLQRPRERRQERQSSLENRWFQAKAEPQDPFLHFQASQTTPLTPLLTSFPFPVKKANKILQDVYCCPNDFICCLSQI